MPENKIYDTNSLGYKLQFQGPATVEEYDRAAGRQNACLEDAIDNTIYRGTLPEWQDAFAKRVPEVIEGATRAVNAEATAAAKARSKNPDKVQNIMETVKRFVQRVTANATAEQKGRLAQIAQEEASKIVIDPSPSKRAAGIEKGYKEKAQSLLILDDAELDAKVQKMLDLVGDYTLERDAENGNKPTEESLARLVKAYIEKLTAEV